MGKGFLLLARLFGKRIDQAGNEMANAEAMKNPELAIELDRETIAAEVKQQALALAQARIKLKAEEDDVVRWQALVDTDTAAMATLEERLAAGTITEAQAVTFLDNFEKEKTRLQVEIEERDAAIEFLTEMEEVVAQLTKQLDSFDSAAKEAINNAELAKARFNLQKMREQNAKIVSNAGKGIGSVGGIGALRSATAGLTAETEASKIVSSVSEKSVSEQKAIDDIRAGSAVKESLADRIKRLG